MQWLKKSSNEEHQTHIITGATFYGNISLLSIVGHGGMGKTTLLQHVYEDEMTKEFDHKIWICVSNNFDAKEVIADMLESLKMSRPPLESLDALQRSLKSEVMSNKFLLVLDDVWDEDESKWENVLAPLASGGSGSKILVTTRMDSVALAIAKVINKKNETLKLEGLEEKECLQLLNSHAFAMVENSDIHHKLRSISECMVQKLSGSPLSAKVIVGVLNSNLDESHWRKVISCDIGRAEPGQNVLLPILRLSYTFLPTPLKNCFAFCGIFSQNHKFDKDDLVRMWIALGFIQLSYNREETLEDIGGRYFDVLANKSFFEKFRSSFAKLYYKMHDLLYELAQSVSALECFKVVDDKELSIPMTIRHLSISNRNLEVLRKMEKIKNLRSLFFFFYDNDQNFVDVLAEILKSSRNIRLLFIHASNQKMIPEVIGNLIHLRYLSLFQTNDTLPRSLSNLYHLQFIIFKRVMYEHQSLPDDFLPKDINNLSNLHYLQLPWDDFPGMHEIGKLNSLQKLDGFYVKNDAGYRIGELEHMNELRQLRIKHLENVKDAEEACSAKLYDKRNLKDLSLQWDPFRSITDPYIDEKVFDSLEPHNSLNKLRIIGYMGAKSAVWMNKAHLFSNLKCIYLDKCSEWQTLPPFGQLPFLTSLYLSKMPKVKRLEYKFHGNDKDCAFQSLKVLHIEKLQALEDWFDATTAADGRLFPCLIKLYLLNCPNLHELSSLLPKLKKLEIDNTGWKACNWLKSTSNCRNISIRNCGNFISLRRQQKVKTTENCQFILSEVVINDPSVLLMESLRSITSLKNLTIQDNDELVSFPIEAEHWFLQVSSSLYELNFKNLNSLKSLPST